jgi:chromosomal replication initiator protein
LELPEHPELDAAWREIRVQLRQAVGSSAYDLWLTSLDIAAWDGTLLRLTAPPATAPWVSERFGRVLRTCVRAVLGPAARVELGGSASAPNTLNSSRATQRVLNPRYSFSQFVIGEGNRLAHAAALAVAELPGQAYNPLFLHAPPGLGKTHLLQAIGNYALRFGGGATVLYATAEEFTNHFLTALSSRSLTDFKRRYRDVDILLLDDVQFLASKAKTEEEFFHTFNALHETGRQLVVTCDRMPAQLIAVEERLRERFEGGLVADIHPPDFATRVTILRKRVELDRIPLTEPEVLDLIAGRVKTNVRVLEGALIRVVAYHSLTGKPIDSDLATHVLDRICPQAESAAPTVREIQRRVAQHFGVSLEELLAATRQARVAWPRQVAIHLSRELAGASLHTLGNAFGGRSHTTILHACKRVSERLAIDSEAAAEVQKLALAVRSKQGDRSY